MRIEIVYTNKALKELKKLGNKLEKQIVKKISFYSKQESFLSQAKKLNPPFVNLYRFRVGDYRVIFTIDNNDVLTILTILTIKHRKDIY